VATNWSVATFWSIYPIHHLLSAELVVTLTCSFIVTRLDYCNSVLYGAPASSIQVLSQVQNSAARIVLQVQRRSHAKPSLRELHWLPIQHRIEVAVLTFKSRRHSSVVTSRLASVNGHFACLPSEYSTSRSPDRLCETSFSLFCANCLELII